MTNTEFHALAKQIAAELGEGWSYTDTSDQGTLLPWSRITHTDGYSLSLGQSEYLNATKNRVIVRGNWATYRNMNGQLETVRPTSTDEYRSLSDNEPNISVSANKPAAVIAKDIARRFLPDYLPRYAATVERAAYWQAAVDTDQSIEQQLDQIDGVTMNDRSRHGGDPRGSVKVGPCQYDDLRVTGGKVELKLSRLTVAQVAAILDTLR